MVENDEVKLQETLATSEKEPWEGDHESVDVITREAVTSVLLGVLLRESDVEELRGAVTDPDDDGVKDAEGSLRDFEPDASALMEADPLLRLVEKV